jgi:hypothetical protein
VAIGALVLVGACSSDGDAGEDDAAAETTASTASTQPPASEAEAVTGSIAELLIRYDDVVNGMLDDPSVAADPDHPLVVEYRSLFEPGNPGVDEALAAWAADAAAGVHFERFDSGHPISKSSLDADLTVVSDDEVTFPTCNVQRFRRFDGAGQETDSVEYTALPGSGTAVRIDGIWRLRELVKAENLIGCATEGPGT